MSLGPLRVYVAAPYEDAAVVRAIHEGMRLRGLVPMSNWAETARGAEDFSRFSVDGLRSAAESNYQDVEQSDVVLVLARHGGGGEMFCEFARALDWNKAVVWTGLRRILSSHDRRVAYVPDLGDALALIDRLAERRAAGADLGEVSP